MPSPGFLRRLAARRAAQCSGQAPGGVGGDFLTARETASGRRRGAFPSECVCSGRGRRFAARTRPHGVCSRTGWRLRGASGAVIGRVGPRAGLVNRLVQADPFSRPVSPFFHELVDTMHGWFSEALYSRRRRYELPCILRSRVLSQETAHSNAASGCNECSDRPQQDTAPIVRR